MDTPGERIHMEEARTVAVQPTSSASSCASVARNALRSACSAPVSGTCERRSSSYPSILRMYTMALAQCSAAGTTLCGSTGHVYGDRIG
jgi:hypothetical protein